MLQRNAAPDLRSNSDESDCRRTFARAVPTAPAVSPDVDRSRGAGGLPALATVALLTTLAATAPLSTAPLSAQVGDNPGATASQPAQETIDLYEASCATCHNSSQSGRTPSRASLASLSPRAIAAALEDGVMRSEGADLTAQQRVAIAEYLTRRAYTAELLPDAAYCSERGPAPLDLESVRWMGYGGNLEGTGFQTAEAAGLTADDVPSLELAWAFGIPGASQVRTKPTVVGDVILVGDQFGHLYAIEAESGCVRWTFQADSGLRSAIVVGESVGRAFAYFMDYRTTAYALDVASGEVVWKNRVGWHPESNNTGAPMLVGDRLVTPISSMEVARGGDPTYECCTSSGAVAAVDVATGDTDWYYRVIPDEPIAAGTNTAGTQLYAPSGAPVWSSPTYDPERGLVYAGTGENYTRPTTDGSDAILALDAETGELVWSFQAYASDAFTMACGFRPGPNCPSPPGPDVDFGMSPMLVTRADGKDVLIAGQKSGVVWALDPDADGEVLWSTRIGKGGALGGIHWGMATDGRYAYATNSDRGAVIVDIHPDQPPSPGVFALDLMTGEVVWSTPTPDVCGDTPRCLRANSAQPTAIPGVVFAGGLDGHIRAYAADDGHIVWDYDTAREYETVNGVPARGGSIDGPGPVVADGMLFVNSGYGSFGQMPGNALLAFKVGTR